MHQLDPVGRFAPSSLDLSRAAAERHAHLAALREGRPRVRLAPRPAWWSGRRRPDVPAFRSGTGRAVGDCSECA